MNILDNLEEIRKLDKSNVLGSISYFPKQCLQALEETKKLEIPNFGEEINNIIICGMGGSAFAGEICKYLFLNELTCPVEIVRDYQLPNYINEKTLVIAASYSGNTEETRSAASDALSKGARLFVLSSNGKLEELLKKDKIYGYVFDPKHNPCGQPRVGAGYMIYGCLGLLIKAGLINVNFEDVVEKIENLNNFRNYEQSVESDENLAKQFAKKLENKFVIPVGSEFLEGVTHAFANQLNETAKANSAYHILPELNHHRMEGLRYPKELKNLAVFIFYLSKLYHKRTQARYNITRQVIEKNGYQVLEFQLKGIDKVTQAMVVFIFNSYVSFYLSILHGVDPNKIPWVDYFKEQLKKLPNEQ